MTENILIRLAKNTRYYRLKKKLTQTELAKKAKMHGSYISRIENAKINISLTTLIRLAKSFGVKPKQLVKK